MIGTGCAAMVMSSVAMLPSVGAQNTPQSFIPGEATALARTMTVKLDLGGGQPIEIGLGNSVARYQNRTATAEGTVLSLGLLSLFLGPSSQCSELPPLIPESQMPPITTGDSRRPAPAKPVEVRAPGTDEEPGGVLGTQQATATPQPQRSEARTDIIPQDFGVLAIDGGRTTVTTRLEGTVREAVAVTEADRVRMLGDVFVIYGPRWEAIARSGSVDTLEGRFTFQKAVILGIERPASAFRDEFLGLAGGISQMLGFLGLEIKYPEVVPDEYGRVEVTPLSIGVKNPPMGIDFIKPLLEAFAPLKEKSWSDMISEDCRNAGILQIADLALGVLSGHGGASLSVGGVAAFTADTDFPEPAPIEFGDDGDEPPAGPAPETPIIQPEVEGFEVTNDFSSSFDTGDFSTSFDEFDSGDPGDFDDLGDASLDEESTDTTPATDDPGGNDIDLPVANLANNRVIPGSKGGAAAVVGIVGLTGLVALAGADRFVMRRSKREIPD